MSVPDNSNNQTPEGENAIPETGKKNLSEIIHANGECSEIKLVIEDYKVSRIITKQQIPMVNGTNIEKICRQYSNQDVLIKIRNGKKISVERIRISKP